MSIVLPLTTMQKAYLLGKSKQFPLSKSSMHDFRELHGSISKVQFTQALTRLVQQYDALRTKINEHALTQEILDTIEIEQQIDDVDLQHLSLDDAWAQVARYKAKYQHYLHDLDTPPWRMAFIQMPHVAPDSTLILASFDGLILDGFSISALLEALFNTQSTPHTTVPISEKVQQPNKQDQQFWLEKISKIDQIPQLPWLTPLDKITDPHYARCSIKVAAQDWLAFSKLASKQRLLPNALLTTVVLEILSKWTEERQILVSVPVSNTALTGGVANHSSFVVLHYQHHLEKNLIERGQEIQHQVMQAMAHSTFSGIDIAKQLIKQTENTLVLPIALTNGLAWKKPVQNETMRYIGGQTQTPQLALDIRLSHSAYTDLMIDFDYVEEALNTHTITDLAHHIKSKIEELSKLTDLQQQPTPQNIDVALEKWQSNSEISQNIESHLAQIEQQLFKKPSNKSALVFDDVAISYQSLAEKVACVATALQGLGIKQKQVVAICLPKSPEHIYVMLACALCNFIWLSVDMDSPQSRQNYILTNSQVDLVVGLSPVSDFNFIHIEDALNTNNATHKWSYQHNETPAYYLYTSGSTGTPKCVVLNNVATANTVEQSKILWNINASDTHLAVTPFHHDMALFDIFLPLSVGGTLVIPTQTQAKSAIDWAQLIEKNKVTVWCSVPAMADMLLTAAQSHQLKSLRLISQGGDYVKPKVIEKFRQILPQTRLISIGGPTETTILSIWHDITPKDQTVIPYGKPIAHNQYHILNEQGEVCPIEVVGQMYMTGINLCNGYLQEGQLKQHDFVQLNHQRAYRMSDRGYLNQNGDIIFTGRNDGYLKVRGVRIAASEVENALLKHAEITDAVVTTCLNPMFEGHELVAIYTTPLQEMSSKALRDFLLQYLPNSHVPTRWLYVAQFPVTRNGKVDRKALQNMAQESLYKNYKEAPIISALQQEILSLIQKVKPEALLEYSLTQIGLTPHYINRIAKKSTAHFKQPIDYYRLAQSRTVKELVDSISQHIKN